MGIVERSTGEVGFAAVVGASRVDEAMTDEGGEWRSGVEWSGLGEEEEVGKNRAKALVP
jgi:hypothetical protein